MKTSERESRLMIHVQPRSSKNALVGWMGETLKIVLTAAPMEGAANAACLEYLAKVLHIPPSQLGLLKGAHSRTKVIRVRGLSQHELDSRLGRSPGSLDTVRESIASR